MCKVGFAGKSDDFRFLFACLSAVFRAVYIKYVAVVRSAVPMAFILAILETNSCGDILSGI